MKMVVTEKILLLETKLTILNIWRISLSDSQRTHLYFEWPDSINEDKLNYATVTVSLPPNLTTKVYLLHMFYVCQYSTRASAQCLLAGCGSSHGFQCYSWLQQWKRDRKCVHWLLKCSTSNGTCLFCLYFLGWSKSYSSFNLNRMGMCIACFTETSERPKGLARNSTWKSVISIVKNVFLMRHALERW